MLTVLLQAQNLPAELADARITFKQFQDMNMLRRHMYMLSFALDFCAQVSTADGHSAPRLGCLLADSLAAASVLGSPGKQWLCWELHRDTPMY